MKYSLNCIAFQAEHPDIPAEPGWPNRQNEALAKNAGHFQMPSISLILVKNYSLTSAAKKFIKIKFLDLVLAVNPTPEPVKKVSGVFLFF